MVMSSGPVDESREDFSVVPVSRFCERYSVSKEVRKTLGLYNEGVRSIGKVEFEQLKLDMKACRLKRQRDETLLWQTAKRVSMVESLEGNTLASSNLYEGYNTVILSSDVLQGEWDPYGSLGKEMLVSEDMESGPLETQVHVLTSAGSTESIPNATFCTRTDHNPGILLSEVSYGRNSSPPPLG